MSGGLSNVTKLSFCLYVVITHLDAIGRDYEIRVVDDSNEDFETTTPLWGTSLVYMATVKDFGPEFSTLSVLVGDSVYQQYRELVNE